MKQGKFIISMLAVAAITFISGKRFISTRDVPPVFPGEGVTSQMMLSEFNPNLKGTNGDTEIYYMKGEEEGGSILILGYTHPNEPSANIAATAIIESLKVGKGDVYVIPYTNRSAVTHNDSQEGNFTHYTLETQSGERTFKFGSRATNPIDQWPDPDIYIHSSGQQLSGSETRNLNRSYPGKIDGTLTEKIAYGITEFIKQNDIDITVDFHEASPEYPVINAMVSHERGMEVAASGMMNMQLEGMEIVLEPSPPNLRGLTHRELGDFTETFPFLFETANAAQGRLRGRTSQEQIVGGIDKFYIKHGKKDILYVPYDENGHSLTERSARQITGVIALMTAIAEFEPENEMYFENAPTYEEMMENGIGSYLK